MHLRNFRSIQKWEFTTLKSANADASVLIRGRGKQTFQRQYIDYMYVQCGFPSHVIARFFPYIDIQMCPAAT